MAETDACPVRSHNEWDPLEEVIVGVVDGAAVPPWHPAVEATVPPEAWDFYRRSDGAFPAAQIEAAHEELEGFAAILEGEGVTVRRPDPVDQSRPFGTAAWSSTGGSSHTFPRDIALIAGDRIVEATMGWRSYYFATHPFRTIFKDYFRRGARWVAAPKPELTDASYNPGYAAAKPDGPPSPDEPFPAATSVITEFEPLLDAGDFMRFGRDILVQRSHVTNAFGIEWTRRLLGDEFRLHEVAFADDHPMHLNATFVPLRPGRVLVNPERVPELPEMFAGWDVLTCPEPAIPADQTMYFCSRWIAMNTLMLDEERIFVEARETELLRLLEKEGFTPIPVPFRTVNTFGGGFHCATLDVRRRGGLEDYFTG